MFKANLKRIMNEKDYNATLLSQKTGIGKSSISQYLSGTNMPSKERLELIARTLGVASEDLTEMKKPAKIRSESGNYNMSVSEVAEILGTSMASVYAGLQDGTLNFGWAVKRSSEYTYIIPSVMFSKVTGIEV